MIASRRKQRRLVWMLLLVGLVVILPLLQLLPYDKHSLKEFLPGSISAEIFYSDDSGSWTDEKCPPHIQGVLLIQHTDMWSGFGTVFFQLSVAQLLYAETYHLHPVIHLGNSSLTVHDPQVHGNGGRQLIGVAGSSIPLVRIPRLEQDFLYPGPPRRGRLREETHTWQLEGTGLWKHYFQELPELSASCTQRLPIYTMPPPHVSPGLFFYAPWSPKAWRYDKSPPIITKPHLTLEEWIRPQRLDMARIIQTHYQLQPQILEMVQASFPSAASRHCLGLNIRWSDKKIARRLLGVQEFLPYVQAYMDQFAMVLTDESPCIYLATDSWLCWKEIQSTWPLDIQNYLFQQPMMEMVRSNDAHHVADLGSHHVVNQQTLVDIVALSNCTFLVHGHSAVSESAIALSAPYADAPGAVLIDHSVNLEDSERTLNNATVFGELVRQVLETYKASKSKVLAALVHHRPLEWWKQGKDEALSCLCMDTSCSIVISSKDADGYPLSISQWTIQVFVELVHQIVVSFSSDENTNGVAVDPLWSYWFQAFSPGISSDSKCPLVLDWSPKTDGLWNATTRKLLSSVYSRQQYATTSSGKMDFALVRRLMHDVLSSTVELRPFVQARAEAVFQVHNTLACLGLYIEDPGHYQKGLKNGKQLLMRDWPREEYFRYIGDYQEAGGSCIYLATDSQDIWEQVRDEIANMTKDDPSHLAIYTQQRVARNWGTTKAHWMEDRIERLGSEVLVDVWNLAKCGAVIHGSHAIPEAALYWNPQVVSVSVSETSNAGNLKPKPQETQEAKSMQASLPLDFQEWLLHIHNS